MELGRISGPLLQSNLLRDSIDLAFETDLLYFNINQQYLGVNTAAPAVTFNVNSDQKTINQIVDNKVTIQNTEIFSNKIRSVIGSLTLLAEDSIRATALKVDDISVSDNFIKSLSDLNLSTNNQLIIDSTSALRLPSNSQLQVEAEGQVSFNSSKNQFEGFGSVRTTLGGISSADDLTKVTINSGQLQFTVNQQTVAIFKETQVEFSSITVDSNTNINGNTIQAIGVLEDLILNPSSGIVNINNLSVGQNQIANNLNTVSILAHENNGYLKISGTNGIVIPSGSSVQRPVLPQTEVGMLRFNTDLNVLELFDQHFSLASGTAKYEDVEEYVSIYSLILG